MSDPMPEWPALAERLRSRRLLTDAALWLTLVSALTAAFVEIRYPDDSLSPVSKSLTEGASMLLLLLSAGLYAWEFRGRHAAVAVRLRHALARPDAAARSVELGAARFRSPRAMMLVLVLPVYLALRNDAYENPFDVAVTVAIGLLLLDFGWLSAWLHGTFRRGPAVRVDESGLWIAALKATVTWPEISEIGFVAPGAPRRPFWSKNLSEPSGPPEIGLAIRLSDPGHTLGRLGLGLLNWRLARQVRQGADWLVLRESLLTGPVDDAVAAALAYHTGRQAPVLLTPPGWGGGPGPFGGTRLVLPNPLPPR
ncbi:hypothetical protein [Catellatospora tritici]|uniref:hypothetical protein n=1 Tax=Catellatospora tritici TaxID=2851566 RepID=UPI001C2D3908|nr:hypothetical protein [Catellatospora tritici]MBV1848738.1 hypothetical protein [Catellatospora tritici]